MSVVFPLEPATLARGGDPEPPPWGNLEALEIPLGDSAELFADRPARLQKTRWIYANYSKERLETLLRSCDLTGEQWAMLQDTNVVMVAPDGMLIKPPDAFVWKLNAPGRQKLYQALAQFPENHAQCFPFRFTPDRVDERLAAASLPAEKQARTKSPIYTNAGFLCFADLQVLPGILSTNELDHVCEAFYRVPAFRLRLRVTPKSDIDRLVKYWGGSGREKFIRPLLESLIKVADRTKGTAINISYLLPPTARLRLYTYPNAWPDPDAERQDCFWTSLNFFHNPPDARFLDSKFNRQTFASEYFPVTGRPVFGDVVTLLDTNANFIHACVYIAADYVFTKNGVNRLQPWVIMKMGDMLTYFPSPSPLRMVIYRHKSSG